MGIAVYCVDVDAAPVARALSAGTRRVSCSRLPQSLALILKGVRQAPPELVVLGGGGALASMVAEALADEPCAEDCVVVAWGVDDPTWSARLTALGARIVERGDDALLGACAEMLDARDGRTVRVASEDDEAGASLHGRRVLVAEDDPAVAWYFGDVLRRAGCDVVEVHDGDAALDQARRSAPDVVLADIRMPGLDGLRLCRALRLDPVLADVPVVLLSWKPDWLARARDQEVGATAYLAKHAVPEEVVARVREALATRVELEGRFRADGPVRGLLTGVSPYRLLRFAAAARVNARLTIRSGPYGFEVHVRDGAPVAAARVSPGGDVVRGPDALGALLSARGGRFVVATERTAVDEDLNGTLHEQVNAHATIARAAGGWAVPVERVSARAPVTPSVPIVVAPTETLRLGASAEPSPSMPLALVKRPSPAPKAAPARRPRASGFWHAVLRTMVGVTAGALLLQADTSAALAAPSVATSPGEAVTLR